jgi:tetratricopeptide (TPR) repeat protein
MQPDESQRLYREASQLFQLGSYNSAIEILDRLYAAYPDNPKVLYARALCLKAVGRSGEAVALCDQLIARHQDPKAAKLRDELTKTAGPPPVSPAGGRIANPCRNHPNIPAVARCEGCAEAFCVNCLISIQGRRYCGSCKALALDSLGVPPAVVAPSIPCKEAGEALTFSIVGIFCFGIVMGPLAISRALKARKMIAANPNLTGSGKATAGLVIGIIDVVGWAVSILANFSNMQ